MNFLEKEQSNFFEYIKNSIIINKKISHAYLIETNGYSNYNKVILEFIKILLTLDKNEETKKKIDYQVDNNIYPDLKFIYPDGIFIKKEQLLQLENQYMKSSMLDNKLIYVIDPADKLNSSSANTILKFLEEPPEGIIAILITDSKYNVLETIVSRCQQLSLINIENNTYSDEILEFVADMNKPRKILEKYDYYNEKLFVDRNMVIDNIKKIEDYLFDILKENITDPDFERNKIIDQIQLIEEEKEKLKYNLNLKLWFSNYIFSIMEVNNNA